MLGTRDEAAKKFAKFVKLAKGNSYIVYQAFSNLDSPTDLQIEDFIRKSLEARSLKREDAAA